MAGCAHCGDEGLQAHEIEGVPEIALAGNPNTGKSSIFNILTGAKQHVGNWPGKTVAKLYGKYDHGDHEIAVVDLPGAYSLIATSPEEAIARDYLVQGTSDVVVIVVDAVNLERNLYLAVQILEVGLPAIIAVNMSDVAASRGINVDTALLSKLLGVPVVATVARSGSGLDELKSAIVSQVSRTVAS